MQVAVITVTQDRRLRKTNHKVFVEWVESKDVRQRWFALRRLFAAFNRFKGKLGLVLESGYSVPLNPYNDYSDDELLYLTDLNARADQASTIAEAEAQKEARQNLLYKTISFCTACFVIAVLALVILVVAKNLGRI